jgi:hypothetical protein
MPFKIFAEQALDQHLGGKLSGLEQEIYAEAAAKLLGFNEDQYIEYLVSKYAQEPLDIHFDNAEVSSEERYVQGWDWFDQTRKTYLKQVITYHIPFSGDFQLLHFRPSTWIAWSMPVDIEGQNISIGIVDNNNDPKEVKNEFDQIKEKIKTNLDHLNHDIASFNSNLAQRAREILAPRRKDLSAQQNVLTSLGVPIRKSGSVPATFSVPTARKKVFAKPISSASPALNAPTPMLDEAIYQDILQTIYDMGKVFERLPSTYSGKDEESLRDHLILQLEPRFEGSTTGETFNKTGKTDILIRYQKGNVFVAECKFGGGKAKHHETIDQLLSYLTWRDSKTAIIYFVRNKEMMPVLNEIRTQTPSHRCFVKSTTEKDPSWQLFELHLPNDPGCKIKLSILAFHIP